MCEKERGQIRRKDRKRVHIHCNALLCGGYKYRIDSIHDIETFHIDLLLIEFRLSYQTSQTLDPVGSPLLLMREVDDRNSNLKVWCRHTTTSL